MKTALTLIKAYHSTGTIKNLEAVLAEGVLLPGIYRQSEASIRAMCSKDANGYEQSYGPSPIARRAVGQLVDEFIEDHHDVLSDYAHQTALRCVDILAGDASRVFLSAYRWTLAADVEKRGFRKTGLVFDAMDLVEKGAAVRAGDFYGSFHEVLKERFRFPFSSETLNRESISKGLVALMEKYAFRGDAATTFLKKGLTDDLMLYKFDREQDDIEVVWDGPLPTDWAVEVWKNGKRLSRGVDR